MKDITLKRRGFLYTLPFVGLHVALLGFGAYSHSPTLNEPSHLVAGLSNWEFGRFDLYKVGPPLVRMVAAAPVILAGANYDWSSYYEGPGTRAELKLGENFVAANGTRSFWLFTLARWACIPFSILGAYICYAWALSLYGSKAGLLALILWCFCPNILAHGQLITSDVAATALAITACYSFWKWLKCPSWRNTFISGLILGLAELAKMTLVVLLPLWFVMWFVYRWVNRNNTPRGTWLRELGMLAVRMVLAVYVVNCGYGFEGTFTRLRDYKFVSKALGAPEVGSEVPATGGNRFAQSWFGPFPVPLPKNYLLGLDMQKRDFEHYYHVSYLNGEFRDSGWWYYYLYALAIKVPLGTWLLFALAVTQGVWVRGCLPARFRRANQVRDSSSGADPVSERQDAELSPVETRDEFVLLSPAVMILVFVSSQTAFSEHMRYALPVLPFFFVWISRTTQQFNRKHPIYVAISSIALTWSIASSIWTYPHSLSYFNELAGGPTGGPNHLIHSNVDWGQDLLFLKRWLDEHPDVRPINLCYFGYFDPKYAGIEYTVPTGFIKAMKVPIPLSEIPPGWYAVSVNFVHGLPYFVYKGDGTKGSLEQNALAAFQELKPVAMAGYSIYIYHIPE